MKKTVLITAGPTYEAIDPVRFIGNRSSGKQGVAIANLFEKNGFNVILIVGPISEFILKKISKNIKIIKINTALEMYNQSINYIGKCDIAIHTAAVADYRPEKSFSHKIKKDDNFNFNSIKFVENPDILSTFGNSPNRPKVVIGFAAETDDIIENAKKKLVKKNCDYIFANNVSGGKIFGEDTNKVYIICKDYILETKRVKKTTIAKKLFEILKKDKKI